VAPSPNKKRPFEDEETETQNDGLKKRKASFYELQMHNINQAHKLIIN
ncbi:32993_t:CDS:1, partial [Racocetra persica]